MKKEVSIKETSALAVTTDMSASWGSEEVEAKDVRISRVLLMQAQSDLVADGKAMPGEMVDSVTGMVLAKKGETLKFVPIYIFKNWVVEEEINGKFEFVKIEEYTAANANQPREPFMHEGKKIRYVLSINVLSMLDKDLDDASAIPCIISFKMTGFKAGQDISTVALRARNVGKPAAYFTISLKSEHTKNEKGNFFVFKMAGVEPTIKFTEVEPTLLKWYQTFKSGKAVVDAEVVEEVYQEAPAPATKNVGEKF